MVNKCYDQLRKKRRCPEFVANDLTWAVLSDKISEHPSAELENRETAQIISLLTNRLSPKQKAVFILSDIEELPHDEISEITGMNKSGIKANLHYARKNISELIEKYYRDDT